MTEEALNARRKYFREYKKKNREKINESNRKWRQNNPEKVKEYNMHYWERKAEKEKGG